MPEALSHLRVLDLSRILAGPFASQILSDLGADVIKVERPGPGDDTRSLGPPFLKALEGRETSDSTYCGSINRGKKIVTLHISTPEGQAILRRRAPASRCAGLRHGYRPAGDHCHSWRLGVWEHCGGRPAPGYGPARFGRLVDERSLSELFGDWHSAQMHGGYQSHHRPLPGFPLQGRGNCPCDRERPPVSKNFANSRNASGWWLTRAMPAA